MNRHLADLPPLHCLEHQLETTHLGWLEPVPEHERHNRQALWSRLERDGYLFLRGGLPAHLSLEFRDFYFSHLQDSGLLEAGTAPHLGIASQGDHDPTKARAAIFGSIVPSQTYQYLCAALEPFFAWLFDSAVHLHKRKLIRHARVGETWVTPAHYDLVYLREGTTNLLSAWIPLGDCPVERGGLIYLEGSHVSSRQRDQSEGGSRRAQHISYDLPSLARQQGTRWLIADYQAGDVVIHSPYIVHASLNNIDANRQMRLSTDIRYQPKFEAIDPRWQNHWHNEDGL